MKVLIVSLTSAVLFSASVSAADANRNSLTAELQTQIAEISEKGMRTIKKSVSDSIDEWAAELFSDMQSSDAKLKLTKQKSQQAQ